MITDILSKNDNLYTSIFNIYFSILKDKMTGSGYGRDTSKERDAGKRSCTCWAISQMATIAESDQGKDRSQGLQPRIPETEVLALSLSSTTFQEHPQEDRLKSGIESDTLIRHSGIRRVSLAFVSQC